MKIKKINIIQVTALLSFFVVGLCSAMSDNTSYNILEQYYQQLDYAKSVLPGDYKVAYANPSDGASTSGEAAVKLLPLDDLKLKLDELKELCKNKQAAVAKNSIKDNQLINVSIDPAIKDELEVINKNLGKLTGSLSTSFDTVTLDTQSYELALFKFEIFKFRCEELKKYLDVAQTRSFVRTWTRASILTSGSKILNEIKFDQIKRSITPKTSLVSILCEGSGASLLDLPDYLKKDLKNHMNAENKAYDVLFVHNFLKALKGDVLARDQVLHNLDMLDYYVSGGNLKWMKDFVTKTLSPAKPSEDK